LTNAKINKLIGWGNEQVIGYNKLKTNNIITKKYTGKAKLLKKTFVEGS